ncbi:MAG: AraC family transcriptional regulator [Clostridia bacterium]|nr:AraC family transcriptional regulator [Clostridia bacterium]
MNKPILADTYIRSYYFENKKTSGAMPNMHYHDHYELYYLLSGERKYFVGDKFSTVQQGDFVAIPPQTPHKTGGQSGWRILFAFDDGFLEKWLTPQAQKIVLNFFNRTFIRPPKEKRDEIISLLSQIEKASSEKQEENIFSALFRLFFILNDSPNATNEETYATKLLHNALEYTQTHYAQIENMDELAKALFVSKSYLCHIFAKYAEVSFVRYLTQIRLKNASEQLKNTKRSISEIAIACGFSTSTYFCQVFKREFGFSPLKYRAIYQKIKVNNAATIIHAAK